MLKFFTSLSFLYLLVIITLLLYGYMYQRDFKKGKVQKNRFPLVFLLISAACLTFLWINIHAPLRLKTFSNLDHHFLQHNGFEFTKNIELGGADTINYQDNPYSRFIFAGGNGDLIINSPYSEEPFYVSGENGYRILSASHPALNKTLVCQIGKEELQLQAVKKDEYELKIGGETFQANLLVKKGINAWNLFKENDQFINSNFYNDGRIVAALSEIYFVRNDVGRKSYGELRIFISGKIFHFVNRLVYEGKVVQPSDLQFKASLADQDQVAWGIGFLTNNRNQYKVRYTGKDSFALINKYPVSYPLTEENRQDWTSQQVNKFLVAGGEDMRHIPAAFREGFLFSYEGTDKSFGFPPLLLDYRKAGKNESPDLNARQLLTGKDVRVVNGSFSVPAKNGGFNWSFSILNTFNWPFEESNLSSSDWQALIFGSLGVFIVLVFFTGLFRHPMSNSWVWQLLTAITMVLLTTRFFLYWRYKSFPPYDGMDLPSQQQLLSFSNFAVIVFATLVLALVFGFGSLQTIYRRIRTSFSNKPITPIYPSHAGNLFKGKLNSLYVPVQKIANRLGSRTVFFAAWGILLCIGGAVAALNNFDPGVCRRLAIGLTVAWFGFLFISYRHSPLVQTAEKSWWRISTRNFFSLVISNPVKMISSVTLLALFAFIDIGFAIVFLNFLFFNEAFLCINYGIARLSAGSNKNAGYFGLLGLGYLLLFVLNLFFAPYIFSFLLNMPSMAFIMGYALFALCMAYLLMRILPLQNRLKKFAIGTTAALVLFAIVFLFFPKEKILEKAAMTKYRIDVLTMPVDESIMTAYEEGKNYQPVIRAAQNQWFINTFIDEQNNPHVHNAGFNLLQHAPQNKGARYNAQATDLVTSRFLVAEHGNWSVLLYALLLMIPGMMLASFYKLYPDFTNRTNSHYPMVTIGFSVLNYLLITALLVILAATGRYIFFGQDLPFASILSKQSILFPGLLLIGVVYLFKQIPQEQYSNRRKLIPGSIIFVFLLLLLFFFKPAFNRNKVFDVENIAGEMDGYVQVRLQPVMDYIDTSTSTRRLSLARKDQLFSDTLRKMIEAGLFDGDNKFFATELKAYARSGLARHLDQRHMLYLDLYTGKPQLAVNDNFFRVEPPPHLQQWWTGNVFGDSTVYNIFLWDQKKSVASLTRIVCEGKRQDVAINRSLSISFLPNGDVAQTSTSLVNHSNTGVQLMLGEELFTIAPQERVPLSNPSRIRILDEAGNDEQVLTIEPDAFMKNYYVNGSRYYVYPMAERFIWARNFATAIASEYTRDTDLKKNAFVSLDFEIMDSLSRMISGMMDRDTSYHAGVEYGISIADGTGRIIAMTDHIKGLNRPDPNDKAAFYKLLHGEKGYVSQTLLRKQIGNINLLRLNPGPGSTFKPVVFSAIASQLDWDWDGFAAEGFVEKQHFFGGEKVPEYDFEKNNGRISRVVDYLKYSDNYYHANVLLLGSYPRQDPRNLLSSHFIEKKPGAGLHWPYFTYTGKQYWLNGFKNWPGYSNGKADFGTDSSFTTIGLLNNYNIYTRPVARSFDMHFSSYDSSLFRNAYRRSGFILPEYSLFDQHGDQVDHRIPYDLFISCFRGHVKGSSQVMVSPLKMVEAFGRMVTQSRNYHLTFNPFAEQSPFQAFDVDKSIAYNRYLSVMREQVFTGMREALFRGTAARLGAALKDGSPYYYYAKTGTTGDDAAKAKSKLLAVVISAKDITDPDFNFRNNKFYTIYFTSQNGPAKQNEAFQAEVIKYLQETTAFRKYMN